MVAVPAKDCDLVVRNAKYFGKVQLWNEGEEKARSGNSKEARQSGYGTRMAPRSQRGMRLAKLVFGFREKTVKDGSS